MCVNQNECIIYGWLLALPPCTCFSESAYLTQYSLTKASVGNKSTMNDAKWRPEMSVTQYNAVYVKCGIAVHRSNNQFKYGNLMQLISHKLNI